MTANSKIKQYTIIGRRKPTEKNPSPKALRMEIFATNTVRALSRFWFFLKKYQHLKKSAGELLSIKQVEESDCLTAKNYGVCIRLQTRTNIVNMYKEYRGLSKSDAVAQMYDDVAARHRGRKSCIEIIKVDLLKDEDCKKENTTTFHVL